MDEQPLAVIQQATTPPTKTLPARPSSSFEPALHSKPANLHGKWHCLACGKSIANRAVNSHLSGNPHKKKQADLEASAHTRQQKDIDSAGQQPEVEEAEPLWMYTSDVLVHSSVPGRAQVVVDVVVRGAAVRPGMWECDVCVRVMRNSSKKSHLKGSPHGKAKQKWTERKETEAQEEELRRAREVAIEMVEQKRAELEEIQRTKQIRIDKDKREALQLLEETIVEEEKQRKAEVQFQRVEQIQIAEEQQKELEEFRRTEQLRIDAEERKRERKVRLIQEEKQRMEVGLQRGKQIQIERAKHKTQRGRDVLCRTEAITTDESEMESLEELRNKQDTVIHQLTNKNNLCRGESGVTLVVETKVDKGVLSGGCGDRWCGSTRRERC